MIQFKSEIKDLFPEELKNLIEELHLKFDSERQALLNARKERQREFDGGKTPNYVEDHPASRTQWKVAPIPVDLLDRRVEITGPISSAKMVINMLSPNQDGETACMAMLDFEDSMCPTWENVQTGIQNIKGVAEKNLEFTQAASGNEPEKTYKLDFKKPMAHPMVRIRGLHLNEDNAIVSGVSVSGGIFDLVCTAYHTAKLFLSDKKTPKFYVPKCEHYLEARWWDKVFSEVESKLSLPAHCLKVTFLIETLPAAFQMEEILFEIKNRACGLNGGRWDKIFSDIKTLKMHKDRVLANRGSIDMSRAWMDDYAKLLIKTCHSHGAFAMGGMSAFTPGSDPEVRRVQTEKVRADKNREATIGHDGCWVSHPYFITMAKAQFKKKNQLDVLLTDFPKHPDLLPKAIGPKTEDGLRQNIRVGIAYQQGWSRGLGCVSFENLMEDLATLEISRAQVWQWLHHGVTLDNGTKVTREWVTQLFDEECESIIASNSKMSESEKKSFIAAKEKVKPIFLSRDLADFYSTALKEAN